MCLGALKNRKLLLMGSQITFWDYVFIEVRVGRVCKMPRTRSKSKHKLTYLNMSGQERDVKRLPFALCSWLPRTVLPSSTFSRSFSFSGVSDHSVYPHFHFPIKSIFLSGMVAVATVRKAPKLRVLNGSEFWFCHLVAL